MFFKENSVGTLFIGIIFCSFAFGGSSSYDPIICSTSNYGFNPPAEIVSDSQGNILVMNGGGTTELPVGNPDNPVVYSGSQYNPSTVSPWITSDKNGNIWFISTGTGNVVATITELPVNNSDSPVMYSSTNYPESVHEVTADNSNIIWLPGGRYTTLPSLVGEAKPGSPR